MPRMNPGTRYRKGDQVIVVDSVYGAGRVGVIVDAVKRWGMIRYKVKDVKTGHWSYYSASALRIYKRYLPGKYDNPVGKCPVCGKYSHYSGVWGVNRRHLFVCRKHGGFWGGFAKEIRKPSRGK